MATIRKRKGHYNVQIRKQGYPSITKTFISKSFVSLTVAKKWVNSIEASMERRLHVVIPDDTTVGELLNRYDREILPTHKGQHLFCHSSFVATELGICCYSTFRLEVSNHGASAQ